MSVSIDIRGDGRSPTLTTSRMSVYFTHTSLSGRSMVGGQNAAIHKKHKMLTGVSANTWTILAERLIEPHKRRRLLFLQTLAADYESRLRAPNSSSVAFAVDTQLPHCRTYPGGTTVCALSVMALIPPSPLRIQTERVSHMSG